MIYSMITQIIICIVIILSTCHKGVLIKRDIDSSKWLRNITVKNVEDAIQYGIHNIYLRDRMEDRIWNANVYVKPGSPSHKQLIDSKPSVDGHLIYRNVELINEASSYLVQKYCLSCGNSEIQCAKDLINIELDHATIEGVCMSDDYYDDSKCQELNSKYRRADGTCNNLKHYFWGKVNTAYKRLLFPAYKDGLSLFDDNPNARKLSTSLVNAISAPDSIKTIAMAIWTIFIGHDLSHTVVSSMLKNNIPVECCREDGYIQYPEHRHPSCAPVIIPSDDEFFSRLEHRCMNYVRSASAVRGDCTFGPREQMNEVTHYLDASTVYGNDEARTSYLRSKRKGELLNSRRNTGEEYMPSSRRPDECTSGDARCFDAGDVRANSLPHLTVMHTLWLREHNRVARRLALVNPHWDDERTFQETRKIIIACVQHITYSEWLPALLGASYGGSRRDRELLEMLPFGYSRLYDEDADPAISNSFATAVLPFVNSMFNDVLILYSENRTMEKILPLMDIYKEPIDNIVTSPGFFSGFVRGLATQNTEEVDMLFTKIVTNYLYHNQSAKNSFGMDIVSLTVQRSRDHGIPSYTKFRKYCGLKAIQSFEDLNQVMVQGAADKLMNKFNYNSWDDIDLFIGALFETHNNDSMVGPTMSCIIREQFIRTRRGDRYFYDLPNMFEQKQLYEIRNITLARIFCDNGDHILNMQQNVFYKPKSDKDLQECTSIPSINFDYWKEHQ